VAECNKNKKIAFVKGRLNFSSKSLTTAANVHLMESLLDNWLKNNHITAHMVYYLCSLLVSFFFTGFSFQTYFSTALILEGAKTLRHQIKGSCKQLMDECFLLPLFQNESSCETFHIKMS